jgi:hypothetical protein
VIGAIAIEGFRRTRRTGRSCISRFESLFLYCIDEITARFGEYRWLPNRTPLTGDIESIRDAKGTISRMMSSDRAYKKTRDQEKFITALNFDKLQKILDLSDISRKHCCGSLTEKMVSILRKSPRSLQWLF